MWSFFGTSLSTYTFFVLFCFSSNELKLEVGMSSEINPLVVRKINFINWSEFDSKFSWDSECTRWSRYSVNQFSHINRSNCPALLGGKMLVLAGSWLEVLGSVGSGWLSNMLRIFSWQCQKQHLPKSVRLQRERSSLMEHSLFLNVHKSSEKSISLGDKLKYSKSYRTTKHAVHTDYARGPSVLYLLTERT